VLAVGTQANKNLKRIVQAVAGLPWQLVVVGAISSEQRSLIADLNVDVENHVDISDTAMAEQYRKADALAFVSTYEGFGLPILEAQASGRPVVTSRRSPMQEVAGSGACLVDPENVDEIRRTLLKIAQDSEYRASLVQAGFDNLHAYTPEAIARRYAALYDYVAAESGR
jgi:glycosyltransferase involved in cell wall biosynthesis